ncbi:MAG: tetratricopeptide repeat protein [Deltaproteobacteria bacterium]|nr:tetratricopeptide repeat protein [Deltaproteobacteria bacterium]
MIGERAANFCDEWFGDDPKVLEGILGRVLELAPQSESALQRLSVLYTHGERWTDLLKLYDRALDATKEKARRIKLLREASQLAKDVANQPDKAIGYLQRLLPLTPDDVQLGQGLERLLERHERWADLIALWEGRLETQNKKDREKSRVRIAACWLDNLRDPARALAAIRPLLAETEDDKEACGLLERIIESKHATKQVREAALDLLRSHYDATARPREVIRVLERVIEIDPATSQALREEAGARLAELDDDGAAMDHYAALLALQPESSVTQEKLRQLAQRSGNFARYAEGVGAAAANAPQVARKIELLAEAARTRAEVLHDPAGAIDLYQSALGVAGAGEHEQLMVSRRLSDLYARADRPKDRLGVLERLADLEKDASARRSVLGEAARLAESLGDTDRALALWQRRIVDDAGDLSALDARISLLEGSGRWSDLIAALDLRAQKNVSAVQKRSDLIRIATVQRDHLNDNDAAIAAWLRVIRDSGEDAETVNALADLYAATGRWAEMADLLERAADRDTLRTTARLVRLGDALREHLAQPERAYAAYRNALAIDPKNAGARAGLLGLTSNASTRARAADALAQSAFANEDWQGFLDILPARLAEAQDDRTRLALYREAAAIQKDRLGDHAGALANLAAAFPLDPKNGLIEADVLALADATGNTAAAANAVKAAIATVGDPREAARMSLVLAGLYVKLSDEDGAYKAYRAVIAIEPGNPVAVRGGALLGAEMSSWDEAVAAVLGLMKARERFDDQLLRELEDKAVAQGAIDSYVRAVDAALPKAGLTNAIASQIYLLTASWHRDRRNDVTSAITNFRRGLELGGDRASTLTELAALERTRPVSPQLLETLRRLADADGTNLDVLVEAAEVAGRIGDRDAAVALLGQILGRATAAWRGAAQVQSSRSPDAVARWAIESLVELHRAAGRTRAAVDLLVEAARLPFDDASKRDLRLRAAQLAGDELGDRPAAIDMYRAALAVAPTDTSIIDRLGALLDAEGRTAELLGLRQIQLGLEIDAERRLALRLDIARLVGVVEEQGGRLEALKANLADRPGHDASIDAVAAFLAAKGQHKALVDLLEGQAQQLEAASDPGRAARLWARFAGVAEHDTHEVERAIAGHRRVVTLAPTADSFRALARLQMDRGQPAQAVPWFESLLGAIAPAERPSIVLQLARAHLGAGQPDRAIAAIESNLDDQQPVIELRTLLADLYRTAEQWEPLARHLTRSLGVVGGGSDEKLVGSFAREAAAIYTDKLGAPAKAIPALEKALSLDPTDKELRGQLAIGLRVAGRLPEARTILTELIADFGRRRSPERAALHVELARVAQAEGKLEEALAELEQAAKMDVNNARIQKELAEMARAAGQQEKSERTYRALLLVVRRQPPGDDEAAVGQSEVLFELSKVAAIRGEADQAKELLESAIDAATQSDVEVRRLRRSLLAHNEPETLRRVLELRLAASAEAQSQARLLADLADVLDQHLDRSADALDALIKALGFAPARVDLHDRARTLAKRINQTTKYVEAVDAVVGRMRRKDDPPVVAGLLMKAGEALEQDAGDLRGAAALYRRVEMLGERLAEAYYAQARVAGALGDTDEQARALDQMLQLAGSDAAEPSTAQLDALYRLAEIFIQTPSRRKQGVDLIERAFAAEPRWAHAGRVLKIASSHDATDARVMSLYERVARNGGDNELLLDFLEKRSRDPGATPAQIREAVDVAIDIGHDGRALALLERAVAAARDTVLGVANAIWAVVALAERRLAAGDLTAARDLTYEIASVAEPKDVEPLAMKVAHRAAREPATMPLAAEMYEFMRERSPSERAIWEPLLGLYRQMGDGDRLASVISSTLPNLVDPIERNALRVQHARYLIEHLQRHHDAIEILRDALGDDPDNIEAAGLLETTLRAIGDDEGLADFLWSRFEDAQKRGARDATIDVAMRLGALLDAAHSPDAGKVYSQALVVAPDDRELLRQVVAHLDQETEPREAALLMERLLAVETPENAPALAWHLASTWEQAGDYAGVQRTLELAHRAAPGDQAVHDRLENWYRETNQWAPLAALMTGDADRATDPAAAVARLREAAGVYAGALGQPLPAAEVLRKARLRLPHAPELVTELAAALAAGGDHGGAREAITAALVDDIKGDARVDLLLLRASIDQQLGDEGAAVAGLEEAFGLDAAKSAHALADGLERQRQRAEATADLPAERAATLRLASLLTQYGEGDRARNLLVGWIEREPRDAEPLYLLRDMDAAIQYWDGVVAACTRLAYITTGPDQVDAALRVADAAAQAGHPADAVPVLEVVHQQQPAAEEIRTKLREFYELAGAHRELAGVLIADADHGADVNQRYANYKRAAELLLYQLGDAASATESARKALELMPEDHAAAMLFVDVQIGSGQIEAAAAGLEAAINAHKKRSPELAVLQQRMARVSQMLGDKDNQLNWLKKAFDVDRKNAEVAAELAQLATEIGDYELALKPLRAITLMENPAPVTRPMALLWEAKIEHARGNRAKAELWAKKALREDPAFADAQQFLDEIGG